MNKDNKDNIDDLDLDIDESYAMSLDEQIEKMDNLKYDGIYYDYYCHPTRLFLGGWREI